MIAAALLSCLVCDNGPVTYRAQREKERVDYIVAEAMLTAAKTVNVTGEVFITAPIETGCFVSHAMPPFSKKLVKFRGDV